MELPLSGAMDDWETLNKLQLIAAVLVLGSNCQGTDLATAQMSLEGTFQTFTKESLLRSAVALGYPTARQGTSLNRVVGSETGGKLDTSYDE